MNNLLQLASLKNRYLCMRHGESIANQQGLIVSAAVNGVSGYGLSDIGRSQILKRINVNAEIDAATRIVSSDFKRARESAEIAHDLLACKAEIKISEKLRERYFGDFELGTNSHYQTVWDNDAISSAHTIDNVESADAVLDRTTSLVLSLEKEYTGEIFLLVSHGDALQILQTAFNRSAASEHRHFPHLETSEIRELLLAS
jgi:probable phosphoglycerate mutase